MTTYNLRRFARPGTLKKMTPEFLVEFLSPHRDFLAERGVPLPSAADADGLDYDALAGFFMMPGPDAPEQLLEALFFVNEMANPVSMDALLEEAERLGISLEGSPDPTPADVAMQMWLKNSEVLERKHAEHQLTRPRSFEYFRKNSLQQLPLFKPPPQVELRNLERELDEWFERKKRGRGCRVFMYPRGDEVWFLVRHGQPFKREETIENGEASSIFYRPGKSDVVVYNSELGEIRMNAGTKGEKELYRQKFGLYLFGSEDFFQGETRYTLEPLRQDGEMCLVCADIEGMEWALLKRIHFKWDGAYEEEEVRKADDIFAAWKARGKKMPQRPAITQAAFLVKFTNVKTPRTVTVRAGNVAQYTRDNDSTVVEDWLVRRGFIVTEGDQKRDYARAFMANA